MSWVKACNHRDSLINILELNRHTWHSLITWQAWRIVSKIWYPSGKEPTGIVGQGRPTLKKNVWKMTGQTRCLQCSNYTNQIFFSIQLSQIATAQGFLLVEGNIIGRTARPMAISNVTLVVLIKTIFQTRINSEHAYMIISIFQIRQRHPLLEVEVSDVKTSGRRWSGVLF